MAKVAPAGGVYQAGTLSGNPLAAAAGIATLKRLSANPPYERLDGLGKRLEDGLRRALGTRNACVQRVGSMLTVFFGIRSATNYDEVLGADTATFGKFFRRMLDAGFWLPPSQFEAWFLSAAHTEADVDRAVRAAEAALGAGP
jgi:glutamate-1-semialdehyde 2,1-aminomutase